MDQALVPKILAIQKTALEDEAYQELLEEHDVLNARFLEVFPTMTKEQQAAVTDYLGLATAMHLRLLELALRDRP